MTSKKYTIGVVSNPNCGKTTLFNALTGTRQRLCNWPGVTVERKVGRYPHDGAEVKVVDLPGTYSLDITDEDISLDEKIARDYVQAGEADIIVNIVDASNLARNLYLSAQLVEMRNPMLVALNMVNAAEVPLMEIDVAKLAAGLGCPVLPVVAMDGRDIDLLKSAIAEAVAYPPIPRAKIPYEASLERAIAALLPDIEASARAAGADERWLAVRLLEGDDLARRIAGQSITDSHLAKLGTTLSDDVDILLADGRYGFANARTRESARCDSGTRCPATARTAWTG